jgi:hypothetical protein
LELVATCVNNTYFQFGQKFYKQKHSMAMGSPHISPVLCNLYLKDLETRALSSFTPKWSLFVPYVDDIFIVWPKDTSPLEEELLAHFNSFSVTIKFTVERERKGSIPFLDVIVTRKNEKVTTEV